MFDHFTGDATGLAIPAHPEAIRTDGAAWLTRAFRAFGALGADNSVASIAAMGPCSGGSTGAKAFLKVTYANPGAQLPEHLFAKFSRDFSDERRDEQGRWEMASEARFAALTCEAGFPIPTPRAMFADFRAADGSGLIITERVLYGEGGIEPHRRKCLDHLTLADPLPHYREVIAALARLAAAHKSGALAGDISTRFPFDPAHGSADPIRYDAASLDAELARCFAYARDCPQLLPPQVRTAEFEASLARDAQLIRMNEARIQRFLTGDARMIALCHWNAHIDNCWFWRDAAGALHCGLIDWGRTGQITLGAALWGGLSAAHHDIWDLHLDGLLALFVAEFGAHGGPAITVDELLFHLRLHMATMGVARVLAFPETIRFRMPDCAKLSGPQDPALEPVALDPARNSMHIYAVFLKFWHKYDAGGAVHELLGRAQ